MSEKIRKKYFCEVCDYNTSDKKDWNKHVLTRKHEKATKMITKSAKKSEDDSLSGTLSTITKPKAKVRKFICNICNRSYKYNSGLSRHMRTTHEEDDITLETPAENNLIKQQQQQIQELQEMLRDTLEHNKKTINNLLPKLGNTFNTTNNKMTINVFLNEQCKDAMNLTDFVNQLQLSIEDLNYTRENGYAKGISNIFVKHLTDLKPTERPIHCSDKKRLQFYVKDENKWEKDFQHEKIDKTIQKISHKQIQQIKEWERQHPSWNTNDKETEMYSQMIQEVMGSTNEKNINIKKELGLSMDLKAAIEDTEKIKDIEI